MILQQLILSPKPLYDLGMAQSEQILVADDDKNILTVWEEYCVDFLDGLKGCVQEEPDAKNPELISIAIGRI